MTALLQIERGYIRRKDAAAASTANDEDPALEDEEGEYRSVGNNAAPSRCRAMRTTARACPTG